MTRRASWLRLLACAALTLMLSSVAIGVAHAHEFEADSHEAEAPCSVCVLSTAQAVVVDAAPSLSCIADEQSLGTQRHSSAAQRFESECFARGPPAGLSSVSFYTAR